MHDEVKVYIPGRRELKIVAIGGGHGLSTMLRGLKRYTKDITAIVTVADDGGGSGMLREDLGILPPGDIRNCILALANTEPTMEQLLDYRFTEGSLAGVTGSEGSSLGGGEGDGAESSVAGSSDLPEQG